MGPLFFNGFILLHDFGSIKGMIDETFRNPESNEFAYIFYMKNYSDLIKIGIAWDLEHRSDEEYGELFDFIESVSESGFLLTNTCCHLSRNLNERSNLNIRFN